MISTTIKSFIQADLASVWHSATSLYDYSWRSDIKDIEVSDERHFKEISNEGYVTCFTITVLKPFLKYSFLMDNENFSGEWTGHFRQIENGTEIIFTELENIKSLDPLLYSKLTHQKILELSREKMHFNPGQFQL